MHPLCGQPSPLWLIGRRWPHCDWAALGGRLGKHRRPARVFGMPHCQWQSYTARTSRDVTPLGQRPSDFGMRLCICVHARERIRVHTLTLLCFPCTGSAMCATRPSAYVYVAHTYAWTRPCGWRREASVVMVISHVDGAHVVILSARRM